MNEAKSSLNFYGISENGWNLQFTLRDDDENKLLERFAAFAKDLTERHVTPKAVGQQAHSSVPGAPAVHSPANPDAPLESIEIDSITLASGGEHPRWVVKGGWATQYGITCWPETLQSAGLLPRLDPMKENLIDKGYVAYYSKKPKKDDPSQMTADKVVKIVALGATPDDVFPHEDDNDVADGTYF